MRRRRLPQPAARQPSFVVGDLPLPAASGNLRPETALHAPVAGAAMASPTAQRCRRLAAMLLCPTQRLSPNFRKRRRGNCSRRNEMHAAEQKMSFRPDRTRESADRDGPRVGQFTPPPPHVPAALCPTAWRPHHVGPALDQTSRKLQRRWLLTSQEQNAKHIIQAIDAGAATGLASGGSATRAVVRRPALHPPGPCLRGRCQCWHPSKLGLLLLMMPLPGCTMSSPAQRST